MEKISMVTEERVIFNDSKIILGRKKFDKEKDLFTIKVDDGEEIAFYNRKTDWNGILGDFWEFVDNYDSDKIVLAHCEDLWKTEDRKELDRVYNSYKTLTESIAMAFNYNTRMALDFAEEYMRG